MKAKLGNLYEMLLYKLFIIIHITYYSTNKDIEDVQLNALYIVMKIYVIGNISKFRIKILFLVSFSESKRVLKTAYNIGKVN